MYSDGSVCCTCYSCIFFYCVGGNGYFCRSFYPAIPLSSHSPSVLPCDRFINFMDHLSFLRSQFDGDIK